MNKELEKAIELLRNEEVVAIPTETVYGLAALITSEKALKKIFTTKERPFFDPLIVHVLDKKQAKSLTSDWNETADILADTFWPGPLTIVLPKNEKVNSLITAELDSVGLRCPAHPLAQEILKRVKIPFAAPSANKFKKTSPTSKAHVIAEFQDDVFVLDGGNCSVGIESTVVGIKENCIEIYRPGMISLKQLKEALSPKLSHIEVRETTSPVAPGQMSDHYQPSSPLLLLQKDESPQPSSQELILPSEASLAARALYHELRELAKKASLIHFYLKDYHQNKDWNAIIDRLKKASSNY